MSATDNAPRSLRDRWIGSQNRTIKRWRDRQRAKCLKKGIPFDENSLPGDINKLNYKGKGVL